MDCTIREWKLSDTNALAEIINNQKVQDNLRDGIPYPYTEKDAHNYIASLLNSDPSKSFAFAIVAAKQIVGSISISRKENVHFRTAELGYYVGEPYWGNGYATSAVKQACEYIFAQTDILRIFAEPYAYNTASCRVLEKSGFQLEGVLRSNAVKNGRILDMKLFSLLKSD